MNQNPKITAVMCTYGRFTCVERAMNCFLAQTYQNKELIIYNTDADDPYMDDACDLTPYGIVLINNDTDFETGTDYTNVGAIRRDALKFAGGSHVVTWDDDDIFLPHFMSQAVDRMEETRLPSFKPEMSFFYSGGSLRLVMNTLEASVVADISKVREYGYLLDTGREGLGWYTKMRDNKELDEHDKRYVPSYCFNWQDGDLMKAPHKQSGDIDNPNNFDNHKRMSMDAVDGRRLTIWDEERISDMYIPYYRYLNDTKTQYPTDLYDRYVK